MRLFKTIAWLTLVLWLAQSLTFVAVFASSFTHAIVRFFISFGLPIPETSLEAFLSRVFNIVSWPVRPLFSSVWSGGNTVTILLLLGLNSLIWGGVLGTFVFFWRRNRAGRSAQR